MKNSENIKDLIEQAKKLREKEEFEKALEILEGIYKENPDCQEIKKSLVETLFFFGGYLNDIFVLKYEKAKEVFERIITLEPDNYRAHYNLGIAFFNLEDINNAKNSFERALKIKPDYKYCFYNLGLIYEEVEKFDKALEYYEKALEIDHNFIYALTARSQVRQKLDDLKKK